MKPVQAGDIEVLQAVIVNGLVPLAKERTPQALYYILKGKKANQTYQDVHLFRLHPYYRLFPALLKGSWEEIMQNLSSRGYIKPEQMGNQPSQHSFSVTDSGLDWLNAKKQEYQLEKWLTGINGVKYGESIQHFWWRLHLLVQTCSFLLHGQTNFIPVVQQREVQRWLKQLLAIPKWRQHALTHLHDELLAILQEYPQALQRLLVDQFSGANQSGRTFTQLAEQFGEPAILLQLKMNYVLQHIHQRLESPTVKAQFPLLAQLVWRSKGRDLRLTESADKTYRYLQAGWGIEDIARRRGLRINTIEDHLVEIALHCPEWDATPFLTAEQVRNIIAFSKQKQTKRLRVLKDGLGDTYSYLQLRLALAIGGRANEHGSG